MPDFNFEALGSSLGGFLTSNNFFGLGKDSTKKDTNPFNIDLKMPDLPYSSALQGLFSGSSSSSSGDNSGLKSLNLFGNNFQFDTTSGDSTFKQLFNKTNIKATANLGNKALNMIDSLIPKNYSGKRGSTRAIADQAYEGINGLVGQINPAAGLAMKASGMLQSGTQALLGQLDNMTTTDALLSSKLATPLLPISVINTGFGKKSKSITKDNSAFETVGGSYSGASNTVDSALTKANKKYGLFSTGARHDANDQIEEANRQQLAVSRIGDMATDRFNLQNSMSEINNRRYAFNMQNPSWFTTVRVGKSGLKVISNDQIERARALLAQKGAKVKPKYNDWIKTVPQDRISPNYDLEKAFEVLPFEMLEDWRKATPEQLNKGEFHLRSIYELPNGDYEFLKLGTEKDNPEVHFETDTFYDGSNGLKESYDLIFNKDRNRYYYIRKKSQKFQDGGKMNVIPDGALHARLNHMDVDNITKKGIPVITQENGGEITQHAEIEKEEIIFTKEVTDQLEKLYKDASNEAAIEAGKLLAREIIENTQDNVGLIGKIK